MNESLEILKELFKKKGKLKWILIVAAIILVVITANRIYLRILELDEIGGLSSIYIKDMVWKIGIGTAAGIIAAAAVLIQNIFIKGTLKKYYQKNAQVPARFYNWLPALAAGIVFGATSNSSMYLNAMKFFNSGDFGITDPLFSNDVGYYVFSRPFLMNLVNYFQGLLIFLIIYTIVYYITGMLRATGTVRVQSFKYPPMLVHIMATAALFLAVRFPIYKFKAESILFGNVVDSTGAGYVDVNIWLKYYRVIPYILVAIVIAAVFFLFRKKYKLAGISIAVFPVAFLITAVVALAVQGLVVQPNEKDKESQYLKYNIEMTREAYDLVGINELDIEATEVLTPQMLTDNRRTIENIRVLDYQSAIRTNTQIQSNTLFYTFMDGDIVNYNLNGIERPVFISARELAPDQLPDNSYINRTYRYTHGYGIVMNPMNETNSQGQIEFILSGLDHESDYDNLVVNRPELYYSELNYGYVVVDANSESDIEINYDGNQYTRYTGEGGIELNFLNRLLFAAKYGDINLLTSTYAKGATLLPNRQVVERAQLGVPFLAIDPDPYILLTEEGKLAWVLDAYTTSDEFPYSQKKEGINYIRNSVKIVIDAYDGKATYYIIDEEDPLINAYDSIYPGIFTREELPDFVKAHMKYPEFLFELQTEMLKKYHLTPEEVDAFYSQQDLWDIAKYPADKNAGSTVDIDSYYVTIKLPGVADETELVLIRPFTPKSTERHNMVAWLNVRNSYENYGELILYTYPKNVNLLGPNQIEVKINQIDEVSKNMTLWGQSGSDVYKGSLLVIPIENSVLYVEPIYIEAAGSASIPEVRQVITGYQVGDQFIYGIGSNVSQALTNMFDSADYTPPGQDDQPGDPGDAPVLDQEQLDELNRKIDELRSNLQELEDLINSLLDGE
ncbi:MAG TPA: UPF0182 family protein [Clostridia bacterium]|nr:UPF0182 family protein [Clostridia bacterium]